MNKAIVLFRKSSFYPEPVVCAVFPYKTVEHEAFEQIDKWKANFFKLFPEFKEAGFFEVSTELIQKQVD